MFTNNFFLSDLRNRFFFFNCCTFCRRLCAKRFFSRIVYEEIGYSVDNRKEKRFSPENIVYNSD